MKGRDRAVPLQVICKIWSTVRNAVREIIAQKNGIKQSNKKAKANYRNISYRINRIIRTNEKDTTKIIRCTFLLISISCCPPLIQAILQFCYKNH